MTLYNLYRKIIPKRIKDKIHRCVAVYISHEVKKRINKTIIFGPFKGMKIDLDDVPLCVLLGTIEKEIHPAFAKLSGFNFDQVINVGATEGYYAIGMALKWPQASVYAFDMQEDIYRAKIMKLASDNLVSERVHARGYCSPADLLSLLSPHKSTLLMLDVEGDELKLLDPSVIKELRRSTIIVELHDCIIPGCSRVIEERFRYTHNITKYISSPRTLADFPLRTWTIVNPIIGPFAVNLISDRNGIQEFFLMIPNHTDA
jgi:hypothetical protein